MLSLGIDLGTTKVAAVIVDGQGKLLAVSSAAHHADLPGGVTGAEQDAQRILECAYAQIAALPATLRSQVAAVGVTGQMHSVLTVADDGMVSPLVTWQDRRCGADRLAQWNRHSGLALREGFGGATLARLAEADGLRNQTYAATVSDFFTMRLAGNPRPYTDPSHAASWGLYDFATGNWREHAVAQLHIPKTLPPSIRPSGSVIGRLTAAMAAQTGLPEGCPIGNAVGDNQASILGTGRDWLHEVYVTLGTGAQLSMVVAEAPGTLPANLELRPFVDGKFLLVSAALCGGAAFAWLGETVNAWLKELELPPQPFGALLDRIDALGLAALDQDGGLRVTPRFLGERDAAAERGGIAGITLDNLTLGALAAATALGVVDNLSRGFTVEQWRDRRKIVGSGNGVRKVALMREAIARKLQLPLELSEAREEAACGAAQLVLNCLRRNGWHN